MPLPEADPPEKSRLYEELKSKTALPSASGAITADLIDNLQNATFLDFENEDQLRRLVLLKEATGAGSTSGPMPGTQQNIEITNPGTSDFVTIFSPGVGEVWQYVAGCVNSTTGATTSITTEVDIYDAANDRRMLFIDIASTSASDFPLSESPAGSPIYISYPLILRVKKEGTYTSSISTHSLIRVR